MASFFGIDLGLGFSGWEVFGGSLGLTLAIIFGTIAIVILGAIGIWVMFQFKLFNKKIVVFENISGQGYYPVFKDRARSVKVGETGEEILYLKKAKVYRTAYGRKMGKNTYWFAVGQDGYWYNFLLGDLDAKGGLLDIEPIDKDMRYSYVGIRKNIADRYQKKKLLTATSVVVGGIVLSIIIMFIGNWFILDKIADVASTNAAAVESYKQLAEVTRQTISQLNTMCNSQPSGVIPVG